MNKRDKKLRKIKSIEIMEKKKVEQWERNDVFQTISLFEWVSLKTDYKN